MKRSDEILNAKRSDPMGVTLLELVTALDALTDDPDRTVELANELILSGRVKLTGNFRGQPWRPH